MGKNTRAIIKTSSRMNIILIFSFVLAVLIVIFGGLKQQESLTIINLIVTMSITMAGFGLVAFQVAHASNELKKDFIETSVIMILSAICGFFYLIYPAKSLIGFNFGELSIFLFFWAFSLLLIILIDKRFDFLR